MTMPRHPKQHQADEEPPINLDARDEAISDLRDAARRAGAAIEPLLRWAFQLQSDPTAAIRNMRKVLTVQNCDNVILRLMAEKVLGTISPETIDASAVSRRARAKRDAEFELRHEIEAELAKRHDLAGMLQSPDDDEVHRRIMDVAYMMVHGPKSMFKAPRRSATPPGSGPLNNVVTFGKPDGDLPPGAA
jgi:hypothetical protein